jgi:hypothetical protein
MEIDDTLRYLTADRVLARTGCVGMAPVVGDGNRQLGRLEGVMVDPVGRRLHYLVVGSNGFMRQTHRLVPVDWPIQLDRQSGAIRLHADGRDLAGCATVEPERLKPFGDDDVLDALFGRVA